MAGFDFHWRASADLISVEDYRRRLRRTVPAMVWNYIEGGADDLLTVAANRAAFERLAFNPRVLAGVDEPHVSCEIAGVPLRAPILLAPTGFAGLAHWTGDVAAARAAEQWGTRYVISTMSSWSLEEIEARTSESHFFQLYPRTSELTSNLMRRAARCGCRVLFITVDTPVIGNREGERKSGMSRPPVLTPARLANMARHPGWLYNLLRHQRIAGRNMVEGGGLKSALQSVDIQSREFMQTSLSWDDVCWIRDHWDGKVFLKGILTAADAQRAVAYGFDGVVVSNHGGRQLDAAPASIDALPAVVAAVAGRAEVLLDSGIRRGSDIVKALALGADAVMIGRPYLYGLAAAGESGVRAVLDIVHEEFVRTLVLLGVGSLKEIDASLLGDRPL